MKKLLVLLFLPLLFTCSSGDDDTPETYMLRLTEDIDRIAFQHLQLPGYNFEMNGETFRLFVLDQGMPFGTADVKVTLTWECYAVGTATYTTDIYVNFFEGQTTWIDIEPAVTCGINPTITITD